MNFNKSKKTRVVLVVKVNYIATKSAKVTFFITKNFKVVIKQLMSKHHSFIFIFLDTQNNNLLLKIHT